MMNKLGQLDDLNIGGIIGGVIGGMISLIVTAKMGGGLFLKLAGFLMTAVVCYIVASKLIDE